MSLSHFKSQVLCLSSLDQSILLKSIKKSTGKSIAWSISLLFDSSTAYHRILHVIITERLNSLHQYVHLTIAQQSVKLMSLSHSCSGLGDTDRRVASQSLNFSHSISLPIASANGGSHYWASMANINILYLSAVLN